MQSITKPYKTAAHSTCTYCYQQASELKAVHVHGFERKEIIHRALIENTAMSGNAYVVADLAAFKQAMVDVHLPIEEHFLFLCSKCHKIYDSVDNHVLNREESAQLRECVDPITKEKTITYPSSDLDQLKVRQIARTRFRAALQNGKVSEDLAQRFILREYSNAILILVFRH